MVDSSALLVFGWKWPNNGGLLSAKVFHYIGARRPILAVAHPCDSLAQLIRDTGSGIARDAPQEIAGIIKTWFDETARRQTTLSFYDPRDRAIEQYTCHEQTQRLSRVLEAAAAGDLSSLTTWRLSDRFRHP